MTTSSGQPETDPQALAAFLSTAPAELREWADAQLALLEGSTPSASAAAAAGGSSRPVPDQSTAGDEASESAGEGADLSDFDAEHEDAPRPPRRPRPAAPAKSGGFGKVNLILVVLLAAAIVIIIRQMGDARQQQMVPPHPVPTSSAEAAPPGMSEFDQVDHEQVNQLKKQLEANPDDIEALAQLGQLYNAAGLYADALEMQERILAIDPENVNALLAAGVAEFQLDQPDKAGARWLKAAALAPDNVEPWYNLGFYYAESNPPQVEKAMEAWQRVIDIDPGSDLAEAAQAHKDGVAKRASATSSPR